MIHIEPNFSVDDAVHRPSPFYEWVGRCIKRWADLEGYVYEIADWALNSERSISAIVFFRTPSFDGRLTLTSDLLKHTLKNEKRRSANEPTNLERWTKLEKGVREIIDFRNALAHHPVSTNYDRTIGMTRPTNMTVEEWRDEVKVTRQHWPDRRRKPSRYSEISIEHMKDHHAKITKLTMVAYHLQHRIEHWSTPLERPAKLRSPPAPPVSPPLTEKPGAKRLRQPPPSAG